MQGLRYGSKIYVVNNELWYADRIFHDHINLKCIMAGKNRANCTNRAVIDLTTHKTKLNGCHLNHSPEVYDTEMRHLINQLKGKAEKSSEGNRQIFDSETK